MPSGGLHGAIVRILHAINQVSGRAGAEISLRDIVTSTVGELEHGVVVLRSAHNVLDPFEAVDVPCYVPTVGRRGRLADVRHVRAAIRDFRPDLLHTSLFDADVAGRIAGALERVAVLSSVVNTAYAPEVGKAEPVGRIKRGAVRLVDRSLARHMTDGFHAISDTVARHIVAEFGVPSQVVRVVRRGRSRHVLGQSSSDRRMAVRDRLGWGAAPVIINVAREEPQKGQRFLLAALPAVLKQHPDALLVMVGRRGRSSPQLDALVRELGIEEAVRRLGVRGDVPDLLSASDVFAFPSLYEGLGGAAVEALGLGLPIVASDVPALRELVAEDRGWLVPAGQADGLAAALLEVLRGGPCVRARAEAARVAFDQCYELDHCLRGMLALYHDIAEQLPTRPRRGPFRRPWLGLSGTDDGHDP